MFGSSMSVPDCLRVPRRVRPVESDEERLLLEAVHVLARATHGDGATEGRGPGAGAGRLVVLSASAASSSSSSSSSSSPVLAVGDRLTLLRALCHVASTTEAVRRHANRCEIGARELKKRSLDDSDDAFRYVS